MMKKYISPIRFIKYLDQDALNEINESNISRIKKHAKAEFNLHPDGVIDIDGYTYNKSDIFDLLDADSALFDLDCHLMIWEDKSFLLFLENCEISQTISEISDWIKDEYYDHSFLISPYLTYSIHHSISEALENKKMKLCTRLLQLQPLLEDDNIPDAYRSVLNKVKEGIRLFKNTSSVNNYAPELNFWKEAEWGLMVNELPEMYGEEQEDMVNESINLTVRMQNSYNEFTKKISTQLMKIENGISQDTRNLIESNHSVFTGSSIAGSSSGESDSIWTKWWFWLLMFNIARFVLGAMK
jgi:hypothetical protein